MASDRKLQIASLAFWGLLADQEAWAMCAMCKKAAEESQVGFLQGIYWSLLLIGGIPLVVFVLAGTAYRRLKRKAAQA